MDEMELTLLEDDNILDLIQEAPGDDEGGGGGENVDLAADDAGDEGGNDNADNNDNNANNDDNNNDNQNQNNDNKGNQENDDNFDIDTEEGDNPDEGEGNEGGDTPDAGTGGDDNTEPQETDAEKERNSAFDRIYNELTPAEKQKRDSVLRMQYRDLYLALDGIINDTSEFPNTTQSNKIVRALIRNLRDFKKYVSFYLTDIYSSKSHLENKIQYDTFMQIFHGVEKIYKDLSTGMSHAYDSYGREIETLNKN